MFKNANTWNAIYKQNSKPTPPRAQPEPGHATTKQPGATVKPPTQCKLPVTDHAGNLTKPKPQTQPEPTQTMNHSTHTHSNQTHSQPHIATSRRAAPRESHQTRPSAGSDKNPLNAPSLADKRRCPYSPAQASAYHRINIITFRVLLFVPFAFMLC